MKRFFIITLFFIMTLCVPSCLYAQETLSATVKIDRIINNSPELIRYCALGDINMVKNLLDKGADPNQTFMKITPSFVAIYKNHYDILDLLMKYNANPNANYLGETILGFSIYKNCYKCSEILVDNSADINLKSLGNYPINIALKYKNYDIAKMLYASGAICDKKCSKILKKIKLNLN